MAWDSDRIVRVVDEPPEAGLPQTACLVIAGFGQPPRPRFPDSDSRRRRGTPRSADRIDSRRWAPRPSPSPRHTPTSGSSASSASFRLAPSRRFAVSAGSWQVVEHRDVARGRHLGPFGRGGNRPVAQRRRLGLRQRSRLVGDEPIERIQREPGDDHNGRDKHDLEEQHHGSEV